MCARLSIILFQAAYLWRLSISKFFKFHFEFRVFAYEMQTQCTDIVKAKPKAVATVGLNCLWYRFSCILFLSCSERRLLVQCSNTQVYIVQLYYVECSGILFQSCSGGLNVYCFIVADLQLYVYSFRVAKLGLNCFGKRSVSATGLLVQCSFQISKVVNSFLSVTVTLMESL